MANSKECNKDYSDKHFCTLFLKDSFENYWKAPAGCRKWCQTRGYDMCGLAERVHINSAPRGHSSRSTPARPTRSTFVRSGCWGAVAYTDRRLEAPHEIGSG